MIRLRLLSTRTHVILRACVKSRLPALATQPATLALTVSRAVHSACIALSPTELGAAAATTPVDNAKSAAVAGKAAGTATTNARIPQPPSPSSSSASPPPPSSVWSNLYLPVKPPSSLSSPALPVQSIKPATPTSVDSAPPSLSRQSPVTAASPTSYSSRPLPRLPLLLLLLLSVPGILLARDDWRAHFIQSYPDVPWPHWMRVEASRLDRLSLEERRRKGESGWTSKRSPAAVGHSDSDSERDSHDSEQQQQQLEEALHALRALQSDHDHWVVERETVEQRVERERKAAQRRSLLSSIAAMESAVRDEIKRQQDEVSTQVRGTESRKRSEFVGRLNAAAADIIHSLALRLTEQRQLIAADERGKLRAAEAQVAQHAREEEVSSGVQRITQRLQQQEEAAETFVRRSMEEEERKLLQQYQAEADSKEAALQWAGKEEARLVRELEDVKQLHYVSANLHRLRLLLSSVEELLHHTPTSSPELWQGVWSVLRSVGTDDPVIATAVSSVSDASLQAGVQPFDELQAAFFKHIERPLRAATLASPQPSAAQPSATPSAPAAGTTSVTPSSLSSHLLSSLLSPFLLPQHSLVAGSDDSSRLSRACYYLYRSAERDIARCVAEIADMRGVEAREAASDWLRHAAHRAAVEQAASVISTRLSTLELSLIDRRHASGRLTASQ